ELLRVLLPALLDRLLHALGRVLRDLLAVLDGLLAGLLDLVLDVVGHAAELLVLHVGRRDQHAGDEPDRDRADGEAEWVLLRDAARLPRLGLDVAAVRRAAGDAVLDAHDA